MLNDCDNKNTSTRTPQQRDHTLSIVFDTITDPAFIMDKTGRILDANNAYAAFFGKEVREVLYTDAYALLPPELAAERGKKVKEALRTRKQFSFDDEQSGRFYRHTFTPIADRDGTFNQIYIVAHDITELKAAEHESEKLQIFSHALIESIPGTFYMVDTNGRFVQWNAYERDVIAGKTESEMQDTFAIDTIHLEDRAMVEAKVMNVMQCGAEETEDVRILLHGGPEFRWFRLSGKKIIINGNPFLIGVGTDITENKMAEAATLVKCEDRFRILFEGHSSAMLVIDDTGNIIDANPAAAAFYGWSTDELRHMHIEQITSKPPEVVSADLIKFKTSKQNIFSVLHRRADGSVRDVEVVSNTITNQGNVIFYCIIHDITDRNRQESIRQKFEKELLESRQFLKSIYDEVNHSIFVVDVRSDGGFRFKGINPIHEKLTGIKSQAITGKTPEEFLDPEVARAVIHNYNNCIREGKTIQYEERIPFEGKDTWWETVLNPVRNESGHIFRIIGTSNNITDRKLAENQLMKMSAAVQQSPAIVMITDPKGTIEYVNPMFTAFTGYTAEEAIGKNPSMLKSGQTPDNVYKDLWQNILAGNIWHGELLNKKKDGNLYWESVIIAAIVNSAGVITNFVGVKEDITEQKKMLDELIAAKEKAIESDRLKSAFLANISHEIRTPMNGILGFSELLREPHLSGEEQAEYIDLINKSGQRMLNLINDLIDISRIEAGETKPQITKTPLNSLLRDLHSFFKPEAEKKGLRISCTTGLPDNKSIIDTDSLKLNQILTNLVQNALKFTNHGGIDIGYTLNNTMLEFYVIDSGRGIPADMTEKIFDRFRQADNSLTRAYEGSGLGLSISKAFVEMLGGTIQVESIEGKGSKFTFTIPYNLTGLPKINLPSADKAEPAGYLSGITILIAEDDEVSNLLIKKSLKEENITTLFAENGQEAVAMIEYHPEINIVLMDIKMPVMNGYEATKQIKQLRPDLPVIAQTAFTSTEDRKKAMEAGCDSFLTKPINKHNMLELMRLLLNR